MRRAPLTSRQALLVAALAAIGLRAWYTGVLWFIGTQSWFGGTWVGPWIRLEAALNVVTIVALVGALLIRRAVVVWIVCLAALAIQALPGARIGLTAMQLLPWVTATTLCLAWVVAWQRSIRLTWITGGVTVVGAVLLPVAVAWGALDFYIAAIVVLIAAVLVMPPSSRPAGDVQAA